MLNTQELTLKYAKIFILGALIIFIIDWIINGNLLQGGKFSEYLIGDILPLLFLCVIGGVYEYAAVKRFKQKFNIAIYCISAALFAVVYSVIFDKIAQSLTVITYTPYTHAGIIIFIFAVGIFYYFNKKREIIVKEYVTSNIDITENKTEVKTNPLMMRIVEVMLGSAIGLVIVVYLFAYRLIVSM